MVRKDIKKDAKLFGSPYKAMQAIRYRSVIIRKWGFSPALLHSVFAGLKSHFRAKVAKAITCNLIFFYKLK